MNRKTKVQKGFIQIPLLVAIIAFVIVATGAGYGGFEYYKTSKIIKEAKQLAKEEKYNEAIKKLETAQTKLVVKNFRLKRQEINNEIKVNKRKFEDKSKFTQALGKLDEGNYQEAINSFSEIPENSFYYKDAQLKTEEAKRKIVEEELGETKIAKKEAEEKAQQEAIKAQQEAIKRSQAEAKAKQEKLEKELKEQQLSEKEAEEKRMNADNDGDGLTYREESSKGTSDLNRDSDYDGIDDGEDTNPTGGGENKPQYFEWEYDGTTWDWTHSIHEDWYNYYNNKPRSSHGLEYITADDPFIQEIAKVLEETAEKEGYHLSSFIISFVQGLPYVADFYTNVADLPKYPVETFIDRNGDCEDFSYLSASLIEATGKGVALVEFDDHMAVGIKTVPEQSGWYYEMDDGRYYYFETTADSYTSRLGDIPEGYAYKQAKITKTWDGETVQAYPQYKKPCYASPDFSGYYYDGGNYYSDSQCNNLVYCLPYEDLYYNYTTESFYWDSSCAQILVKGCSKSTNYSGYFTNSIDYYFDSQCIQKARICRPSSVYSDGYWDGDYSYWDSNCTQKVVSWCSKSTYHTGYFFNNLDYKYYYDYQCTQKADF